MLIFAIVGAVGLILLIISSFLDGIFDFVDFGVSSIALSLALLFFGGTGLLFTNFNFGLIATLIFSLVAAILVAVFAQAIINHLIQTEDGATTYDLAGLTGVATSKITDNSGEVSLYDPREVESRLAWSEMPLEAGTKIRVVARSGSRVKVEEDKPIPDSPYGL